MSLSWNFTWLFSSGAERCTQTSPRVALEATRVGCAADGCAFLRTATECVRHHGHRLPQTEPQAAEPAWPWLCLLEMNSACSRVFAEMTRQFSTFDINYFHKYCFLKKRDDPWFVGKGVVFVASDGDSEGHSSGDDSYGFSLMRELRGFLVCWSSLYRASRRVCVYTRQ